MRHMARSAQDIQDILLAALVGLSCAVQGSAQTTTHWLQQFGSSGSDQAHATASSQSSIYVAGTTTGTLSGQSSSGQDDAFVRKYDLSGSVVWTRQFGTTGIDSGDAVAVDASGVYVAGSTTGTFAGQSSAGGQDGYVRKYDANGDVVWTRQFGGTDVDTALGVAVNLSGVVVAGSTVVSGLPQAVVRKFDANGTLLWTRTFGGGTTTTIQAAAADDGGFYVAGRSSGVLPGQSQAGAFVRRYDLGGVEQWTSQFGPANAVANGVVALSDAVYIAGTVNGTLAGQSSSGFIDAFVRRYNLSGVEQWTRQFGTSGTDDALAVAGDPTGVYVAGQTNGQLAGATSVGSYDAFVTKHDVDGNQRWAQQLGSFTNDTARGLSTNSFGVYVAGLAGGTIAGQSSAGGPDDAFVAQLDLGGPPYVPFNGVVNAASYTQAVVAGSIASVFGLSLMPQNAASLQLKVGGITAPIFADSPAQINFQVPWEAAGQNPVFLVVNSDGNSTSPVSIPITSYAPALFSTDGSGSGQGAVLIANTAIVAAPSGMFPGSHAVSRDDFISIFATGLGPVSNPPATGAAASGNSTTLATTTVTIGGIATPAAFAGLAPDFVGLYQVNVRVPASVTPGNAVTLSVSVAGTGSNTVTIAVQ
jgi:uncharacterized protein (TIGR03437 family)